MISWFTGSERIKIIQIDFYYQYKSLGKITKLFAKVLFRYDLHNLTAAKQIRLHQSHQVCGLFLSFFLKSEF